MRYFIELSYKGTNYHGWQVQKDRITIQSCINDALTNVLRAPTTCVGASRTDTGVHARQSFAMFDAKKKVPEMFLKRINKVLPNDIAIKRVVEVAHHKQVRHDATQRSYEYRMHFTKDPLLSGLSYLCPYSDLDLKVMKSATRMLQRHSDFTILSRRDRQKTTICKIKKCKWEVNEATGQWVFTISADRFLWGMVRRIVGAMIMIGFGRLSVKEFEEAMRTNTPLRINHKAPAEGLYLTEIRYPFL